MTKATRPIADYIEVESSFTRSINLERDFGPSRSRDSYIVTPTARQALRRVFEGIEADSPARAWTVTGPYGTGKSAFAVFLTRLLCAEDSKAQSAIDKLDEADPQLVETASAFRGSGSKGRMLPVLITARRTHAAACIAEGLLASVKNERDPKLQSLSEEIAEIEEDTHKDSFDTRVLINAFEKVSAVARESDYAGILLIVDELGKLFEHAARYPLKGDVYVLQELAELASRSGEVPLILVGILHQAFEEYARHLDLGTRREWEKIQGRFAEIAFREPPAQIMKMVGNAINWKRKRPKGLRDAIQKVVSAAIDCEIAPPGMSDSEFQEAAFDAYPLHPTTLVALPHLFQRFGQNERSLFSYLNSSEAHGFREFLAAAKLSPESPPFVRLSDVFNYFITNLGFHISRDSKAIHWLEAADILDSKNNLDQIQRDVVKTTGVLNVLGQFCKLDGSAQTISNALHDSDQASSEIKPVLEDLRKRSIVTYRKFNDTYRIWEGSDVDVAERVEEGRTNVRRTFRLADSIERYMVNRPMVARRHSFETGALRSFEVNYLDDPDDLEAAAAAETEFDGKVIVCLGESGAVAEIFRKNVETATDQKNILYAIPQQIGQLRETVIELGSLRWVWKSTPELRDDRVARREVSKRISEAEHLLLRNLNGLLDPRPEPVGSHCLWFYDGQKQKVVTPVGLSQLLSDVCDKIYSEAPTIRNELITRRSLSPSAVAARRNLVEGMLERGDQPLLGIDGFPPERSMYESVLHATGLHQQMKGEKWGFCKPDKLNLLPAWQHLYKLIFGRSPEPIVLKELFAELSRPPYGVLGGLHPVLLCAFMQIYKDEVTLYRENTFIPNPEIADFEILMRRPELYAVAGCRVTDERAVVVERISKALGVPATTLSVVRELFRRVKSLPEFAWRTQRLPHTTIALRNAFDNAQSPEKFLFVEIPQALGLPDLARDGLTQDDVRRFFDALNENLQMWAQAPTQTYNQAKDALLRSCGIEPETAGWQELRQQSVGIQESVTDARLRAFVKRIAESEPTPEGIKPVLGLVAERPVDSWSDDDAERFPKFAEKIGNMFQEEVERTGTSFWHRRGIDALPKKKQKKAKEILKVLQQHISKDMQKDRDVLRAVLAEISKGHN